MQSFEIVTPVDGSVLSTRYFATSAMVEQAAARAEAASPEWSRVPLTERAALVDALVTRLEARRDLIADRVTWQMGRPRTQADEMARLRLATDAAIRDAADFLAPRVIKAGDGISRYVTRDAIGPSLSICAWNYPVAMMATLVIHPLLAGNTVLLKHAPQTAEIGDFLNQAADEAGFPTGVLNALDMTHEDTERLIASGRFPLVQFIGSTRGGKQVYRAASLGLARVGLELGGSDPAYIRPDVNIDAIVADLAEGCFGNAGQSCCSVERLYVHSDIHDRFVEAFAEATRAVTIGHPVEAPAYIGPVVTTAAAERIRRTVAQSVDAGAHAIMPGGPSPLAGPDSAYVEAHILVGVDHGMAVMREESFGPIAPIMRVSGDEEAVVLMNATDYGLTASIWSGDVETAQALGARVRSGTLYINRCDHADLSLPWGGVRQSGVGRSYAREGFDELTVARAHHVRPPLG